MTSTAHTALITGTTSGIGEALATKLAAEGHGLVLVSRDEGKLQEQARQLAARYGVRVDTIPVDLLEADAANKVFNAVRQRGLEISLLVNNAGFNEFGPFASTSLQQEIGMIQLHAVRTTEMMKLFLPSMIKNRQGRVLNLGSTGSYMPCPCDAVYGATKAYVLSLSKAVNTELRGSGVTVTALCPGSTRTQFALKAGMEDTLLFRLFVMDPATVAGIGYRALIKGRPVVVAGLYNKLLVHSSKIMPFWLLSRCTALMLRAK